MNTSFVNHKGISSATQFTTNHTGKPGSLNVFGFNVSIDMGFSDRGVTTRDATVALINISGQQCTNQTIQIFKNKNN